MRVIATHRIDIVVPSIDFVYPQSYLPGDVVPEDVAAFCVEQGWARSDQHSVEPPAPTAAAGNATAPPEPASLEPASPEAAAAAAAAAAAVTVAAPAAPQPVVTARMKRRAEAPDPETGASVVYAKGAIVTGAVAEQMLALGYAAEVSEG